MNRQAQHWDRVYETKSPEEVSWYSPHLETSIELIKRVSNDRTRAIIDVGGGESTLVDDLLSSGYTDVTVLDISEKAIEVTKQRLGMPAGRVKWIGQNICETDLPADRYHLWHDRAVFHFLTTPEQRAAYISRAATVIRRNGHLIIGTFGPQAPERCSGLDVVRYDAAALQEEFGPQFHLLDSQITQHVTPARELQQFLYCLFERA